MMINRSKIRAFFKDEFVFFCASPALAWQLFFLITPLLIILYCSVVIKGDPSVFSFSNFTQLISINFGIVLLRTSLCALLVATLCLLIAFPASYFLVIAVEDRWRNFFLFLFTLPFWTNFLILVYSWFFLLDRYGLVNLLLMKSGLISSPALLANNIVAVVIVMVYCYLPFMLLPLYGAMGRITHEVLEASMDLGASWFQTFCFVIVPLSFSGIKTGFLLVLVPAFGEFAIPSLIGGARHLFAGSLMTHYFLTVRDEGIGSAFTVLSLGVLLCIVGILYLCSKVIERNRENL
jgi:spermidine/putrescine transport system permease protein